MADEVKDVVAEEVVQTEELETKQASRGAERNKDLSEKVKETANERDAAQKAREEAEKERDFYKDFSKQSSKYPNAADYEDEIREKVLKGYDMNDAVVAVLNKKGKLNMNQPKQEREIVAGGSATTNPSQGSKGVKDMTQAERLQALREAEARGDIGLS